MTGFRAVLRKELRGLFNSPVAYIVAVLYLVFTSVWFFVIQDFFAADLASLRGYYAIMPVVFTVLVPAITMRMWSEERRSGTDEVLLTLPVSEAQLVLGKYAAGLVLLASAVALTLFVPLSVGPLGDFERGEIAGQYVGLLLLGSAGLAIGQLVSALSRNQVSAFLSATVVLLALTLLGRVNVVLAPGGAVAELLSYLSLERHYRGFNRGVLDTRDLVYFAGVTALGLYLTTRVLVRRKLL